MQSFHPAENRLRFVFNDTVFSLNFAASATFEDIARSLEEFSIEHYGHPVSIDVILPSPGAPS